MIEAPVYCSAMVPELSPWKPVKSLGFFSTHLHADGKYESFAVCRRGNATRRWSKISEGNAYTHMRGNEVFKVAVRTLMGIAEQTLAANGMDKSQVDWLIPHQANIRIIEATAKKLGLDSERVVITVDRHGKHVRRIRASCA